MLHLLKKLLITCAVLIIAACGTTSKTEADHYNNLRDDPIYKVYQKASIEAMKPVVKEYNKKLAEQNQAQTGETQVHSLLAFLWVTSLQSKYALAEAEYAADSANDVHDRYAALTLQSLALHEEGLPHLAKEKSVLAKSLIQSNNLSHDYNNALTLVYVAGSALALKEGNIPYVANEVRELGVATNQGWLTELGDATNDVYAGAHDKAISKLEHIRSNSDLTDQERAGVDRVLEVVKAGGKDVVSGTANAVVTNVLYVGLQKNALTAQIVEAIPEKYREKLVSLL